MYPPGAITAKCGWLGINAGDWLSSVTNALAIIGAILIAAKIAPMAAQRSARRDQRERLLRTLIATSPLPANPDYQGAIALIPVDFKGNKRVLDARERYLAVVNTPAPTGDPEASAHVKKTINRQADLIAAVAQELDFDLSRESLLAGAYISKGFVDREQLHIEALKAWPRIAEALERNNNMFAWSIGAASEATGGDEPDNGGTAKATATS